MCLRKICNLAFHVELDALWLLNNEVLPAFSCIVLTMVISLKKERKKKKQWSFQSLHSWIYKINHSVYCLKHCLSYYFFLYHTFIMHSNFAFLFTVLTHLDDLFNFSDIWSYPEIMAAEGATKFIQLRTTTPILLFLTIWASCFMGKANISLTSQPLSRYTWYACTLLLGKSRADNQCGTAS